MTDWRDRARCGGLADETYATADPFHPKPSAKGSEPVYDHARALCARCPVITECLADAYATEPVGRGSEGRYGMRGGLTPKEREAIYRKERRNSPIKGAYGPISDLEHQRRLGLLREGLTDVELAKAVGLASATTIATWRKKHDLPANTPIGWAKGQQRTELWQQGFDDATIARLTGDSRGTVARWRRRRGFAEAGRVSA